MKWLYTVLACCFGSCFLLASEKNQVVELINSSYQKSVVVYSINDGVLTIYKESHENKAPRLIGGEIDMIVFVSKPLLKYKGRKSDTGFFTGLSMRIVGNNVMTSSLFGKVSKASLVDVEALLRALAKANNFAPIVVIK